MKNSFLIKSNISTGDKVFAKAWGNPWMFSEAKDIIADSDLLYVTGDTTYTRNWNLDIYVLKMFSNGSFISHSLIGGYDADEVFNM